MGSILKKKSLIKHSRLQLQRVHTINKLLGLNPRVMRSDFTLKVPKSHYRVFAVRDITVKNLN